MDLLPTSSVNNIYIGLLGTALIFAVAGRTALAHEFTTQPTLLDHRGFDFTTMERLGDVIVHE